LLAIALASYIKATLKLKSYVVFGWGEMERRGGIILKFP
jgi:hypothetical protein